jgi:hypothetical protein
MKVYSRTLRRFLDKWPGKKYLGIYRFLPIFFFLGAALEFAMINWHVGEVNFCKFCDICSFHGSEDSSYVLLCYDTMYPED